MNFPRMALAAGLVAVAFAAGAQQAERKTYIVQLADAPVASYTGNVSGLAATKPAAGRRLDVSASNVQAYVAFLDSQRSTVLAKISGAKVVHKYDIAFNGFAAQLTEAQARKLKGVAGVVAVSADEVRHADTNNTPAFLGLSIPGGLWSQQDASGRDIKGEDVIIGVIDSGIWPEDPSFGDKVSGGNPVAYYESGTSVYGAPPAKWKGICQTGPGFTAAMCGNKLIGARYYVDGYKTFGALSPLEFVSPRDGDGHGSHTASTAGGNNGSQVVVTGVPMAISGMAPRARVAAYKALWHSPNPADPAQGVNSDLVAAINAAVADGVDVINYSISGTTTNYLDPVEVAFFNASAAGVFVATSAGNSGPGNTVAHPSPWLMTVAASTDNKLQSANAVLGNGNSYTGVASIPYTPVSSKSLIESSKAGKAGVPVSEANLCFLGSLDPAKVAGKIVICDRGTNARVDKSLEVKNAGGVGMILVDPPGGAGPVADPHSVPTIHLPQTYYSAVHGYAAGAGNSATAALSTATTDPAPVMAGFSSRGPSLANSNVLKPDITAPGVAINAAYAAELTQSEHDAVAAGTLTPPPAAETISGTSMSSPHTAGVAALFKQMHPTWTPYAIKSALMTSTNGVLLASGAPDPARFGYGAGHLNPNVAAAQGLVYDSGPVDYLRFLCGANVVCLGYGSIQPWELNLASLTASSVVGQVTFNRTVKNVTSTSQTYNASASVPGYTVQVVPSSLTLAPGASASFKLSLTRGSAPLNAYAFGNVVWTPTGGGAAVTSPVTARAVAFAAPASVSDTRAAGTKTFSVGTGFDGSLVTTPVGLTPAKRKASSVAQDAAQCFAYSVPAGTSVVRFQTFNSETQGGSSTDLDLEIYSNATGAFIGGSGGPTADEVVTLTGLAGGTYTACVIGYATPPGGASFVLNRFIVGPAVGTQSLKAAGPSSVSLGGTASVGLGWNVPAGKRYLGVVNFTDGSGTALGSTIVSVDAL